LTEADKLLSRSGSNGEGEESKEVQFGLNEEWYSIEGILREIIPVYDKTNRFISFGTDLKVRTEGLSLLIKHLTASGKNSFNVLDLGSGPGKMTQVLTSLAERENSARISESLMLDALGPMMNVALKRNETSEGVLGIYEAVPVRSLSFSSAIAGFALRDSRNLLKALEEIHRILEDKGYFLIVDLSRPDSLAKRSLVGLYWIALAPLIAFFAAGRLGLKFGALYTTYELLPKKKDFLALLNSAGFDIVEKRFSMMDGVCVILLQKKVP
jgi:demethylmenaquinone methyltransferase / 2-methoxy-6-polyprenyl-1,4-benzoquinol methylase